MERCRVRGVGGRRAGRAKKRREPWRGEAPARRPKGKLRVAGLRVAAAGAVSAAPVGAARVMRVAPAGVARTVLGRARATGDCAGA